MPKKPKTKPSPIKKKVVDGKVFLEMPEVDYETLMDWVKDANRYFFLVEEHEELSGNYARTLIQKAWALSAIPTKRATEKNFRECAMRLDWKSPGKGNKPEFDPKRVIDFFEALKKKLPYKAKDEKQKIIEAVREQFGFASLESTCKYLRRQGISNLPGLRT